MEEIAVNHEFKRSVTDYLWEFRESDGHFGQRDVLALCQKYDVPQIVAQIMVLRGISFEDAELFLNPSLKQALPDPSHLLDMDVAVKRLADAVESQEKIVIFGDYDVDGATSSALLKRFFAMVGLDVGTYIPDRLSEGYGPNVSAMKELRKKSNNIVITVDCGAVSYEPLSVAKEIGLDVIVIDHHLGGELLPEAVAVVNPNRLDETSECRNLAAVGVAFLLAIAVNRELRERGFYKGEKQPDLLSLLDLVALGTVCDVMTLTGLNRVFVQQGLKILAARGNLGLKALGDVARLDGYPNVYHLGFLLGPRINAGGRVGQADLGTKLLTTADIDEAYEISQELDRLNLERKAIEEQVLDEALLIAEELDEQGNAFLLVSQKQGSYWHPGVIGIVASRIKDRFHKPCAILSIEDGVAKASARSVSGVDLGAAISIARSQDILIAGGGHAMAAGFSVDEGRIPELQLFLNQRLGDKIETYISNKSLKIDLTIPLSSVTVELVKSLDSLAPFGNGNAEPRFVIKNLKIVKTKIMGTNHLMVILKETGIGASKITVKAMAFRALETVLGDAILQAGEKHVDIVGKIKLNNWQGLEKAEIIMDDMSYV